MRATRRAAALLTVVALVAAGCGRDEDDAAADEEEEAAGTEEAEETSGDAGGALADGEFGDMGVVCQEGDASGDPDLGVTDDEIVVGTVTDRGSEVRAGLNQEMWDVADAFVAWCNEHGGINGRELVLEDLDARLTDYDERIVEACDDTFALVGGGAVFDDGDEGYRAECGLANIPGFVVTPEARAGEHQIQPVPNPVHQMPVQTYSTIREHDPDIDRFGMIWVNFPGPMTIAEQVREMVEASGYDIVFDQQAQPEGERGWASFVREMRDNDVQVVEYVGEPEDMTRLLDAMQVEGWYPEYVLGQANMYDQMLVDGAGESLGEGGVLTRSSFPPFDLGDEVPALGDYLALMDEYRPDGKYPALLGFQALSAWLLFAQSATECGDDLTRDCLLDNAAAVDEWTAGGLHGTTNPGNLEASQCGLMLRVLPEGFVIDEELTDANEGLYNCSPDNVMDLAGDYGVEAPAR